MTVIHMAPDPAVSALPSAFTVAHQVAPLVDLHAYSTGLAQQHDHCMHLESGTNPRIMKSKRLDACTLHG
jgi:hypothetical protein